MQKICKACNEEKDIELFSRDKYNIDGRASQCKACRKEYRDTHKKERAKYNRQYRIDNIDRCKSNAKQYYIDNKEHIHKQHQLYRDTHKKESYEYQRKFLLDPTNNIIHKIRGRTSMGIARLGITKSYSSLTYLGCDSLTLLEWLQWSGERYDPNFNILDYDGQEYHIDHIKSFEDVKKGIYTLDEVTHYTNLQILTATENLSKGGTSWGE